MLTSLIITIYYQVCTWPVKCLAMPIPCAANCIDVPVTHYESDNSLCNISGNVKNHQHSCLHILNIGNTDELGRATETSSITTPNILQQSKIFY